MFYHCIDTLDMSKQVAELINSYSDLAIPRVGTDIITGNTNYVVETHGKYVIGICGLLKVSAQLSELKHLVVHPQWRGKGVGSFIAKRALDICKTPLVYATVKKNNQPSLGVFEKLGFKRTEEFPGSEQTLIFLVRVSPKCEKLSSTSRRSLPTKIAWVDIAKLGLDMSVESEKPKKAAS